MDSIIWYSKSKNSIAFNKRLRSLKNPLKDEQYIHYKKLIKMLYENKTKNEMIVYRGLKDMKPEKVKEMFDKPYHGFFSTTKVKDYNFFTSPHLRCCLLEITIPKNSPGLDISEFSKYKDEEEFLLPPGILLYKNEYNQKLDYMSDDVYMKVYQCVYHPFSLQKVKIEKVKECISKYLKKD
jgi:hypothetical protein